MKSEARRVFDFYSLGASSFPVYSGRVVLSLPLKLRQKEDVNRIACKN